MRFDQDTPSRAMVVYDPARACIARIRAVCASDAVLHETNWADFERSAAMISGPLVLVPSQTLEPIVDTLRRLRRRFRLRAVIAIVLGNHRTELLQAAGADEAIPATEIASKLPRALRHARAREPLLHLADTLRSSQDLSPLVRAALTRAALSEPPIRSVQDLAKSLGCDRTTLWYHWRTVGTSELRLEDVIDWFLLLHASGLKTHNRSWENIAHELAVHPHTLGRMADRLVGVPLRVLEAAGQPALLDLFANRVVRRLVPSMPARAAPTPSGDA